MRMLIFCISLILALEARAGDDFRDITRSLYCPTCAGQVLDESHTGVAVAMKKEIRKLLKEGKTPEQIRDHFVALYGERILLNPPLQTHTLLLWLFPGLIAVLIIYTMRRRLRFLQ